MAGSQSGTMKIWDVEAAKSKFNTRDKIYWGALLHSFQPFSIKNSSTNNALKNPKGRSMDLKGWSILEYKGAPSHPPDVSFNQ